MKQKGKRKGRKQMKTAKKQSFRINKMRNKARFWTGIGLIVPEVLAMLIVGLNLINWSFLTFRVLGCVAIVLYNVLAGILIWNGSSQKK